MRSITTLAAASVAAMLTTTPALAEITPAAKRAPASEIKLKNLKGKRVKLSKLKGKVVVVNFWATWCVPCLQELPFLQKYYKKYKKDGLEILAITIDGPDTFARVRSVVKRRRWTMPILLDQDGSVAAELNPRGTNPFTIFVDRQGRVARAHEGYSSGDEKAIEATIKALLAEKT